MSQPSSPDPSSDVPASTQERTVPRVVAVAVLAALGLVVVLAAAYAFSLRGDLDAASARADQAEQKAATTEKALTTLQTTVDGLRERREADREAYEADGWEADDAPGIYVRLPKDDPTDGPCAIEGCALFEVRIDSVRSCPDRLVVNADVLLDDEKIGTTEKTFERVEAGSMLDALFAWKDVEGDVIQLATIECS